jgi:DHA2 family multidrug resistance protein
LAFVMAPMMTIAFSSVKPQDMANVNGLVSFTRTICVAIATSLCVTYWQNAATLGRVGIAEHIDGPDAVDRLGAAGMPHEQAVHMLDAMVQGQSVMLATNTSYITFSAVALFGVACVWLMPKTRPRAVAAK